MLKPHVYVQICTCIHVYIHVVESDLCILGGDSILAPPSCLVFSESTSSESTVPLLQGQRRGHYLAVQGYWLFQSCQLEDEGEGGEKRMSEEEEEQVYIKQIDKEEQKGIQLHVKGGVVSGCGQWVVYSHSMDKLW